ncbi:uncharacterized protein BX664DRAFT_334804 [Halteromyces radiatus]|uniref:uncharacterized protein n=1 Tax=Halteromyces radiatus TaxID=101107 RepID=UPI00221E5374|nr:uncharacterized protein BX664DRAFT_334804 [Halteromyces radiatus]KAI8086055.1 hypothetical protein BX664DRAFT_334804 [Halteromyces radiatus]
MVASPSTEPLVDFDLYDKQETIDRFEAILPYFRRDLATTHNVVVKCTATQLASFTASFQHFQYTVVGNPSVIQAARFSSITHKKPKGGSQTTTTNNTSNDINSRPTWPPCLPPSMFQVDQLQPASPLYIILKTAFAHQPDFDLWDFDSHKKRNEYLELTHLMFQQLQEAGFYSPPKIFLIGLTDEKEQDIISMVNELKGQMVTDRSKATHVVVFHKNDTKDDSKRITSRMVHILESIDKRVLIHWYRYPDSYNEWVDERKIKDNKRFEETSPEQQEQPIYVQSSWLTDSYKFNTWMNPMDYACSTSVIAGLKRSLDTTGDNISGDDSIDDINKRFRRNNTDLQDQARRYLPTQTYEVIIPSYAAWFEIDNIHKIERRSLPEFFNGANQTKSPTVYMNIRNFMINTYRLNPLEYLTVTACRRNLPGDVCTVIRVHGFLEKWGLINYQIDPTLKMSNIGPPFTGNFKVVVDMPESLRSSSLPSFIPKDNNKVTSTNEPKDTSTNGKALNVNREQQATEEGQSIPKLDKINLNLELRQSVYRSPTPLRTLKKHSNNKDQATGQSPALSSKLDSMDDEDGNKDDKNATIDNNTTDIPSLTDQQKVLLLEGLEMFAHDWSAVAKHVGISREQCILHYLELPLEDPFVDLDVLRLGLAHFDEKHRKQRCDNNNPLASVLAFLEANADPDTVNSIVANNSKQTTKDISNRTVANGDDDNMDINKQQQQQQKSLAQDLIRSKLKLFKQKLRQYLKQESLVEQERQSLEEERRQLVLDQCELRNKADLIYQEISNTRGSMDGQLIKDSDNENKRNYEGSNGRITSASIQQPHQQTNQPLSNLRPIAPPPPSTSSSKHISATISSTSPS